MTTSGLQPKSTPPRNSFNGGELSPLLDARWDINKYHNGCKTLENAMPLVEGGAKKMPGTYYVVPSGDVNGKSRLAPFSFNTDQSYVIEFSEYKIRIFDGNLLGIVQAPETPEAPTYDPDTAYEVGDYVTVGNYWPIEFGDPDTGPSFYIASPPGDQPWGTIIFVVTNSTDTLTVESDGQEPYAKIWIRLANVTGSKNTASLIQTGIRALGSINGFDTTEWTVTANAAYETYPQIIGFQTGFVYAHEAVYQCIQNNQTNYFPPFEEDYWTADLPTGDLVTLEVDTPYLEEHLFELDVSTQSGDVLYIFHHLYPAKRLERRSATLWVLADIEFLGTKDIARTGYQQIARIISDITNANPAVVSCAEHGFSDDEEVYINHVYGMAEVNQGRFTVTVIDEDTFSIGIDSTNYGAYVEGGWAVEIVELFNGVGEYPGCGTFFEQRLVLGGFDNHPGRINGSVSGDYHNFISDPELVDYAVQFDLVSNKKDAILWMVGQTKLVLGTASAIWVVSGAGGNALSQTSVDTSRQITMGTCRVAPQIINDSIIWLTRVARIAKLLQYEWSSDKWIAPDLTRIARHITIGEDADTSGIIQTAYQQEPYPILWAIRNDGQLLGLTFEAQEQVYAWFRIKTDGLFESIAVVPQENDEDRVWVVVNREST